MLKDICISPSLKLPGVSLQHILQPRHAKQPTGILSLFSVISTFGTPQDITTDELRIEAFYPTDTKTEQFFNSLA